MNLETKLLAMPLQEAVELLKGYEIVLQKSTADTVKKNKLSPEEFCSPRVIKAVLQGNRAVLVFTECKELA
ncbi:MAG: hypothetical protein SPL05_00355 [Eubacteriales bacterium]|nr:hypothetical protein [Eubacteriales bacterium]